MSIAVRCTMKVIKHFSIASFKVIKSDKQVSSARFKKNRGLYNFLLTYINKRAKGINKYSHNLYMSNWTFLLICLLNYLYPAFLSFLIQGNLQKQQQVVTVIGMQLAHESSHIGIVWAGVFWFNYNAVAP